jgi:hypothetical protein
MFNSNIIDVAIGLVFIFLLLSLICSAAHELIEMLLKERAANLEKGIQELAGSDPKDFVSKLYSHGLINSLYAGKYEGEAKSLFTRLYKRYIKGQDLPSYIPSKNFALALIDLEKTGADLPGNIKDALQAFRRVAGQDVSVLQQHIEAWFNSSMDRVSGWYKRRSQWIVLVLGLAAAVAVNADCIAIAKRLSTNSNLRKSVEQLAESTIKDMPAPAASQPAGAGSQTTDTANPTPNAPSGSNGQLDATAALHQIQQHLSTLDALGLPVGRDYSLKSPSQLWTATRAHWLGWLITALAVSLGAPFWFDMLNKIMVVRSTVKPSEKSGTEGSKDAKPPSPAPVVEVQNPAPDQLDGN